MPFVIQEGELGRLQAQRLEHAFYRSLGRIVSARHIHEVLDGRAVAEEGPVAQALRRFELLELQGAVATAGGLVGHELGF